MAATDRILDQAQTALAAGDPKTAQGLVQAILADEPENTRAQQIGSQATAMINYGV